MPRRHALRLLTGLIASLIAFGAVGCSHYQRGTDATLAFSTLYVAPVRDDAALPQAAALATSQIRERFLRDGRIRLVDSPEDAEAILYVTLVRYERGIATVRPNDTGLARKLELTLSAEATLLNPRTRSEWFSRRPLSGRRQAFTDDPGQAETFGNQGQAERQTWVLLAGTIADAAVGATLDVW
jgi:hypothetical protein